MDGLQTDDANQRAKASHWVRKVQSIRVATLGNKRAPYKPLLLLWIIGRLFDTPNSVQQLRPPMQPQTRFPFCDVESELSQLMEKHRMGDTRARVQYPFVYLGTDRDLWLVKDAEDNNVALMKQSDRESRKFPDRSRGLRLPCS